MDELKAIIRGIINSLGRRTTEREFRKSFNEIEGRKFQEVLNENRMNFPQFMFSLGDICRCYKVDDEWVVEPKSNEATAHLQSLTIKKKKRPKIVTRSFRMPLRSYYRPNVSNPPKMQSSQRPMSSFNSAASETPRRTLPSGSTNKNITRNPGVYYSHTAYYNNNLPSRKPVHAGLPTIIFKPKPKTPSSNENTENGALNQNPEPTKITNTCASNPEPVTNTRAKDPDPVKITKTCAKYPEPAENTRIQSLLHRLDQRKANLKNVAPTQLESEQKITFYKKLEDKQDIDEEVKISVNETGTKRKVQMKTTENENYRSGALEESSSSDSWITSESEKEIVKTKKSPNEILKERRFRANQTITPKIGVASNSVLKDPPPKLKKVSTISEINEGVKKLSIRERNDHQRPLVRAIHRHLGLQTNQWTETDRTHIDIRKNYVSDSKHQIDHAEIVPVANPQTFEVKIINISDPTLFKFQFGLDELSELTDDMTCHYGTLENAALYRIAQFEVNMLAAVNFKSSWYRAKMIKKINSDVLCYFMDYDVSEWISMKQIFYLAKIFTEPTKKSCRGSLYGVRPFQGNSWDSNAITRFKVLVENKKVRAYVKDIMENVFSLSLALDINETMTKVIANELIKQDYASADVRSKKYKYAILV